MRVLVAGRNATVLATAAGAFAGDMTIETAATKAASIALLERHEFDLIIACEKLGDGSGLEVLSHVAVNTPNTLRIFAARPSTLNLLKGELGLFGLFRTLPYPINFRKLWASLNLARECQVEGEPNAQGEPRANEPAVRHVVLESDWQAGMPASAPRASGPTAAPRRASGTAGPARAANPAQIAHAPRATAGSAQIPHLTRVATGAAAPVRNPGATRLASPTRAADAAQVAYPKRASTTPPAPIRTAGTTRPAPQARASTPSRAATRTPSPAPPIPVSDAFRRAVAKRNATKLEANSRFSPADLDRATQQSHGTGNRGRPRREPGVTNESLAQLAQLTTTRRPAYDLRNAMGGKSRAALFVGSGVFAAATAAVLTFFMVNANNSIGRTPLVASIDRPVPHNVLPWQPTPAPQQQPTRTAFIQSEAAAPAAADLEVEAEAQSDASAIEPGHPGPPPPFSPPPPSEPPAVDYTGMPPEE
jgi:hypothetical protein